MFIFRLCGRMGSGTSVIPVKGNDHDDQDGDDDTLRFTFSYVTIDPLRIGMNRNRGPRRIRSIPFNSYKPGDKWFHDWFKSLHGLPKTDNIEIVDYRGQLITFPSDEFISYNRKPYQVYNTITGCSSSGVREWKFHLMEDPLCKNQEDPYVPHVDYRIDLLKALDFLRESPLSLIKDLIHIIISYVQPYVIVRCIIQLPMIFHSRTDTYECIYGETVGQLKTKIRQKSYELRKELKFDGHAIMLERCEYWQWWENLFEYDFFTHKDSDLLTLEMHNQLLRLTFPLSSMKQ